MAGMEIASLFAKVGADTGDFKKAMQGVHGDLADGEKSANKFGATATAVFKTVAVAAVALGTAVVAAVSSSLSAAADMEQGIADIGAMMALTSAETATLQEHIMDLGLDPTLKVSATEASAAVMALGTAGLSVAEIMGGASEATVLLANATGLKGEGLANAANIATDVMAQFNITAGDMNAAVDQIAGTTVASKFTIDDYRLAIAQAGGVAGSVGVEFEDFNAVIAATSPSFASGSDAGTSFKTFLQRLVPTTDKAKEALMQLGLSTGEDVVTAFFDASGAMRPMEEIAANLHTAFSGLSEAQRIEAASTIFGTDAMRTALALADGGRDIIVKMKKEIGNVDAEELAKKRMDTLKGSWEIFQGVVETLQLSLGQKFIPVARQVVEWTTDLAQKYGPKLINWVDELMKNLGPLIDDMSAWAKSVLPPLWDGLGEVGRILQALIKPVTDNIGKFFSWKDVLMGLVSVLVGSMAGSVLGAIVSVVAGLATFLAPIAAAIAAVAALRFAWENDLGKIRTTTQEAVQKISDWFFKESGIWKGTWADTAKYVVDVIDRFWRIDLFNMTVGTWSNIKADLIFHWTVLKDRAATFAQQVKDTVAGWVNDTVAKVTNWKDRFISFFQDTFGDSIKKISDWARVTISQVNTWVQHWKDKLQPWYDWVIDKFQGIFDWWDEHVQPWVDKGREIVAGLRRGIEEKWNAFTTWWKGIWTGTVDWVKNLLGIHSPSTVFETIGVNIMAGLTAGLDSAKQGPLNTLSELATQAQSKMTNVIDTVKNSAKTIRDEINNMPALPGGYWSTPAGPNTPTMPVTPPVVIPPPQQDDRGPISSAPSEFGTRSLSAGLNNLAAFVDVSDTISEIQTFAMLARSRLTSGGQTMQGSSAEAMAIDALTGTGIRNNSIDNVLAMLQTLVREIRERGLGSDIEINMAPDASLQQRTELEEFVTWLNARYV